MKSNELVWRTLLDGAVKGNLTWPSLADLAFQSGVPLTTTHLAIQKLSDIGAVFQLRSGGLSVVNPDKVATVLCAWRNLKKDIVATTTREAFLELSSGNRRFALGGPDAAIELLGGVNKVADFSRSIGYCENATSVDWPEGEELIVLQMDDRAVLDWDGFSSFAQTYADLFATPGWQATEFRLALKEKFLPEKSWEVDGGGRF